MKVITHKKTTTAYKQYLYNNRYIELFTPVINKW